MSARVVITSAGDAEIRFDFSYAVVEELKRRIPAYARWYDPETKVWTVAPGPFVAVAIDILKECFGKTRVNVAAVETLRDRGVA